MSGSKPFSAVFVAMQFPTPSETFLSRELRALRAKGARVSVASIKNSHPLALRLADEQRVSDVEVIRPRLSPLAMLAAIASLGPVKALRLTLESLADPTLPMSTRIRYCAALPGALACAYHLLKKRPDVIHLYWGHYPSLVLALLEGHLPQTKRTMFLGAYDLFRAGRISAKAAEQCAAVFTHAKANVPQIKSLLGDIDIQVAYRGIDVGGFFDRPSDLASRQPFAIVTVGRLVAGKRFDLVLEAFAVIRIRAPLAVLHVIGDGPALADLRDLARRLGIGDAVIFHGRLPEKDVQRHMLAAKAFVLLSEKEGECLPNVLKEAMAAGCVCVSSRSQGIDELVTHAHNGYIVDDPSDVQSVAACLLPHLGVEVVEDIQSNAIAQIRERFDVRRTVDTYVDIWTHPA